jgi:NTE family protein
MKYEGLILSSGGIKGILQLGVLDFLYKNKYLESIKYYSGCSVGALISVLLSVGYTPHEIFDYICVNNIFNLIKYINPLLVPNEFGVINIELLHKYINTMVINKIGFVPTFEELEKMFDKKLIIPSCKLNGEDNFVYFTTESNPTMSITKAAILSSSIPLIFTKSEYEGNLYIDGAIFDSFPINIQRTYFNDITNIGITFKNDVGLNFNKIKDYMYSIFMIIKKLEKNKEKVFQENDFIFEIKNELNGLEFDMTIDSAISLFLNGKKQISSYISSRTVEEVEHESVENNKIKEKND